MSNYELHKNAEGYTDPTAAATLNRKESGDIWEYKGGECLILKSHPGFATILKLHDNDKYGDRVKVADRDDGPRYVDPAFLITGRFQEMGRYVETLDAVTFEKVITAVEAAICIDLCPAEKSGPVHQVQMVQLEQAEEVAQLRADLKAMQDLAALKQAAADAAGKAEMKARNQLELLREMYNELLAKAVGGGVVNNAY